MLLLDLFLGLVGLRIRNDARQLQDQLVLCGVTCQSLAHFAGFGVLPRIIRQQCMLQVCLQRLVPKRGHLPALLECKDIKATFNLYLASHRFTGFLGLLHLWRLRSRLGSRVNFASILLVRFTVDLDIAPDPLSLGQRGP